jgi:hypothetical protein
MNSDSWMSTPLLRNERLLHFGMALLLALFVVVGLFLQRQVSQSVQAIGLDREHCMSLSLSESTVRGAVIDAQENLAKLQLDYASVIRTIPKRVVDSEVLSAIRGLSQSSHCSLIDFRPGATHTQSDFQTRSYDLHLEGGFKSLFQFFESLPQVPFAHQIGRFKIAEPSTPGGGCRFDVELKVVFDHAWARTE